MISKLKNTTENLKEIYEKGLEIIESNNLYDVWPKVPKGKKGSFNEMVRQNFPQKTYIDWWNELENIFSSNNLNFLRLKKKVWRQDSSEQFAVGHAARLHIALEIIEKLIEDPRYIEGYKLTKPKVQRWPEITFESKTIKQGNSFHKFSNEPCIEMLKRLWQDRGIMKPDRTLVRDPLVHDWKEFKGSIERNKGIAQAVNKSMRSKKISLRIKYPQDSNGLVLIVTQN